MSQSDQVEDVPRHKLIDAILEAYPRLDRGMAELVLEVHELMKAEHGEDYAPEDIFPVEGIPDDAPSGWETSGPQ
jgi:hypothetical protein